MKNGRFLVFIFENDKPHDPWVIYIKLEFTRRRKTCTPARPCCRRRKARKWESNQFLIFSLGHIFNASEVLYSTSFSLFLQAVIKVNASVNLSKLAANRIFLIKHVFFILKTCLQHRIFYKYALNLNFFM